MCGTQIVWDKNRLEKVKEPVMTIDALRKLSFGQCVIIRQRKNPYLSWLKSFDSYGLKLPETPELQERRLPEAQIYDIRDSFKQKKRQEEKPLKNFEIDTEKILKEEEIRLKQGEEYQVLSHFRDSESKDHPMKKGEGLGLNEI